MTRHDLPAIEVLVAHGYTVGLGGIASHAIAPTQETRWAQSIAAQPLRLASVPKDKPDKGPNTTSGTGQTGTTGPGLAWHGHSMVIDPWGNRLVATDGGADDARARIVVADLDLAEQARVRGILPSLANRRPATYRWPE